MHATMFSSVFEVRRSMLYYLASQMVKKRTHEDRLGLFRAATIVLAAPTVTYTDFAAGIGTNHHAMETSDFIFKIK